MKKGLYERILKEKDLIHDNRITKRKVDASEESKTLSINYQKFLREKLSSFEKLEDKISFIKDLNRFIGIDNYIDNDKDLIELTAYHDDELELKNLSEFRPKTSLSSSTLFVGSANGPSLEGELRREIRTSDEIYMLISFIKFSGLRLILDELKEFTKTKKLKVITTSYMGASDYKAILELSKLPNTEIKSSYDTDRSRLHAKSYLFIRDTGFSTAYIGSSNLSNPAINDPFTVVCIHTIHAIAANKVLSTICKCPTKTHNITPIPVFIFLIPGLCNFKTYTPFIFMTKLYDKYLYPTLFIIIN